MVAVVVDEVEGIGERMEREFATIVEPQGQGMAWMREKEKEC